jgi:hypothetical protein
MGCFTYILADIFINSSGHPEFVNPIAIVYHQQQNATSLCGFDFGRELQRQRCKNYNATSILVRLKKLIVT